MKNLQNIFIITAAIFLSSCAAVYVPNTHNVPLLSDKGDVYANGSMGTNGYDLQGAYAITDNIGVMLSTSTANKTSDSTRNFHRHAFIEGGAGYYTKLSDAARFEVFGGGGFGSVSGLYGYNFIVYQEDIVMGNYYRFFIQPTIGSTSEYFDGAFAFKFSYFDAYNLRGNNIAQYTTMDSFIMEPTITVRGGYKFIMAHLQTGVAIPFGGSPDFRWRPFIFNVGLTYKMNFNKKASTDL